MGAPTIPGGGSKAKITSVASASNITSPAMVKQVNPTIVDGSVNAASYLKAINVAQNAPTYAMANEAMLEGNQIGTNNLWKQKATNEQF